MTVTTIAFDAYGTLFDTAEGSIQATRRILRNNGSELDPSVVYASWKAVHKEIVAALTSFKTEAEIFVEGLSRVLEMHGIAGDPGADVQFLLDTLGVRELFWDVIPCFAELRARFDLVIASNTDSRPLLENLRRSGLAVDGWFTSESLGVYKPDPKFYNRMLAELRKRPEEVVFVGDTLESDALAPAECGIRSVWLNRNNQLSPGRDEIPTVSTLSELPEVIRLDRSTS